MASSPATPVPLVEFATAGRPFPGEPVSGDRFVVEAFPDGVLLAVIDGLGHGTEAAQAAQAAADVLEDHAHEPLVPLVQRSHSSLTATRGVVMSLASVSGLAGTITWLGVGNVEGVLIRAAGTPGSPGSPRESLLSRGGIVGYQLPPLRASVIPIHPGDLLVLATDGISDDFVTALTPEETPQRLADGILDRFGKVNDDALVLVARYRGHAS